MSIQGSFNHMLSSLVYATSAVRQAKAQERIASVQEGEAERAERRIAIQELTAQTESKREESLNKLRAAKVYKIRAEGRNINKQTKAIKAGKQKETMGKVAVNTAENDAINAYSGRMEEVTNGRGAVGTIKKALKGEDENV